MIIWTAALALSVQAAEGGEAACRDRNIAEIEADLSACGLRDISVSDEDTSMLSYIAVADNEVSDAQLECAFSVVDRTRHILVWVEAVSPRFYDLVERLARPRAVMGAKDYFADRPELGPLPTRASGESDLEFARELERFCGPGAEGFTAEAFGSQVTVSPNWIANQDYDVTSQHLGCMMNAAILLDIKIGFVGNDKAAGDD